MILIHDKAIISDPACLRIDKDFKCFIADKECPSNIHVDTRNGTKTEPVDEHSKLSAVIIIAGVFLSIVIMTAVIGFIFYKKLKMGKGKHLPFLSVYCIR